MAKKKINIAYVGISKVATERELHTLPTTLRSMVNVATKKNGNKAEKENTKKVLFGLLGIINESEIGNIINLPNEIKKMRKACFAYYPYIQDEGVDKTFLKRKGCYYSRQGSNDTPTKGHYYVVNDDYNNIVHTAEKSRTKSIAQKVYNLNTLYTAEGVALAMEEIKEDTNSITPIGYTLYSRCKDDKTDKTYYKPCKQQPFEIAVTTAEMLKLEDAITKAEKQ